MRTSHYLLGTQKEIPSDAELTSHQLMLRAGLIRKIASGIYSWLPTGQRVLNNVIAIVRQEMERAGASEVLLPSVIPAELWQQTGRWDRYGDELLKLTDRHKREFCYGPTHEEVITLLARFEIKSYKQLPLNFFQIQTKFRDEIRPRFGVMRAREFIMKDAYSFHTSMESLQETYEAMGEAYERIIARLGLKARRVIADSGAIGGEKTHEFQVLAEAGEDQIFYSDGSDYAANVEKASALPPEPARGAPTQALDQFATPGVKTIQDLARDYGVAATESIKTLVGKNARGDFFALALRGDHALNLTKVTKLPMMHGVFTLATAQEIVEQFNAPPGSLGVVRCPVPVIVDYEAAHLAHFVCGANEKDQHYRGVHWMRDVGDHSLADIRNVAEGDASPDGRGRLRSCRGIEVGHIFQLGTTYSHKMQATVLDEAGKAQPLIMGCYGFGVTRVIAACIEQCHDERGILWPLALAPFQVAIVPLQYQQSEVARRAADQLYQRLQGLGITVLLNDGTERPGVMFAEMDLIGIPYRVLVSEKHWSNGQVELKARRESEGELVDVEVAVQRLCSSLKQQAPLGGTV